MAASVCSDCFLASSLTVGVREGQGPKVLIVGLKVRSLADPAWLVS